MLCLPPAHQQHCITPAQGALHTAGVNNAYLVNVRHELALVYNDASVLENRHLAAMYGLLAGGAKADVLAAVDPTRWRELRKLIINAVIHTDMVHHFPMVSKARATAHGLASNSVDTAKLAVCSNHRVVYGADSQAAPLPHCLWSVCSPSHPMLLKSALLPPRNGSGLVICWFTLHLVVNVDM